MIITLNAFGRGFSPLSNPKHKTCLLRRANKKRKKRRYKRCTRVNRDLLTSVLTCSISILHRFHSVVDISMRSKLWISYGGGDNSIACVALVMYYFRTSHRQDAHIYPVPLRTNSITIYVSDLCHIRYRVFPTKTPAFNVQWVANPLCTYALYSVPYNCLLAY
jgi:hypothetical protein